ncbi:MAG: c-type cytochrome [Opitutus sp.]|nr:c-type cytochrome [Opitutus sp.]
MRTITSLPLFVCVVLSASSLMANSAANTAATDPLLTRGKYLVQNVGLCADCHSPRNERGEFIPELWLEGAPLPFAPTVPMPWSPAAPPIAGLPSMTEEQAIVFLQSGTRPDGSRPLPPMPEYRFDAEDARAVVAYLKSLTK